MLRFRTRRCTRGSGDRSPPIVEQTSCKRDDYVSDYPILFLPMHNVPNRSHMILDYGLGSLFLRRPSREKDYSPEDEEQWH